MPKAEDKAVEYGIPLKKNLELAGMHRDMLSPDRKCV
jgi:hypothetical protein